MSNNIPNRQNSGEKMFGLGLQHKIDNTIEKHHVQPVGNGYIDCICPMDNAISFIEAMSTIGVRVTGFSWWCHVTETHSPCGMGGPMDKYGDGWYSEIEMFKTYDFSCNNDIIKYLSLTWPTEQSYKSCYVPAFYLDVPNKWKSRH